MTLKLLTPFLFLIVSSPANAELAETPIIEMNQPYDNTPLDLIPEKSAEEVLPPTTINALKAPEKPVPLNTPPPTAWDEGLNIFAAIGTNSSVFRNSVERRRTGQGLSFGTQIAYFTREDMAFEIGSIVNFNRLDAFWVWDTLFSVGVRTRIPFVKYDDHFAPYLRFFVGAGPSVIYFDEEYRAFNNSSSERVHLFGNVYGGAIGLLRKYTKKRMLFVEAVLAYHKFEYIEEVRSEGDVPIVVNRETLNDGSYAYHLSLLIGIRAF